MMVCRRGGARFALSVVLVLLLVPSTAAVASVLYGGCVEDVTPFGTNCTSNDVTFILVGLGTQTDGCVAQGFGTCSVSGGVCDPTDPGVADCPEISSGTGVCSGTGEPCTSTAQCSGTELCIETCQAVDSVNIFLQAQVRNNTAQDRYDIGLWFANDGDPNGDGAITGSCGREMLHPTRMCSGTATPTPCDVDGDCSLGTCELPGYCSNSTSTICFADSDCTGGTCTLPGQQCPPLDLIGNDGGRADGPFLVGEAGSSNSQIDRCGDLRDENNSGCDEDGNGDWDDSILTFVDPIEFPCLDTEDDGFINIPTCATWGNQADEVHLGQCSGGNDAGAFCQANNDCGGGGTCVAYGVCSDTALACLADSDCGAGATCEFDSSDGATCESETEVIPGTPAKCRCEETLNTTIPAPQLDLACSCTGNTGPPGAGFDCTVSYSNTSTCTPDGATPEAEQCGTSAYIRFDLDDGLAGTDPANGEFTEILAEVNGTASSVPTDVLEFAPTSANGTDYIIGPNRSGSVEFRYTSSDSAPTGPITLTAETIWSNDAAFTSTSTQTLSATCPLNIDPTWTSVASFRAFEHAGRSLVEWRTSAEVGTLGFELYRLDGSNAHRVGDGLVSALQRSEGGVYRLEDPAVRAGAAVRYSLVEVGRSGKRTTHGPFRVVVEPESRGAASREALAQAEPARPALPELRRLEKSAREASRYRADRSAGGGTAAKAGIGHTDLYRWEAADLATRLDLPLATVKNRIRNGGLMLESQGYEISWRGTPDGSALYFFGEALDSLFAEHNIYWARPQRGTQVTVRAGGNPVPDPGGSFLDSVLVEEDNFAATVAAQSPEEDYWFWDFLFAGNATHARKTFDVEVPDLATWAETPAELTVSLYGATRTFDGSHHAVVRVNDTEVGDLLFTDLGAARQTFALPAGLLEDGANQVEIEAIEEPGVAMSIFYLDSLEVHYPRRFRALDDRLAFRGDGRQVVTVEGFDSPEIQVWEVSDPRRPMLVQGTTIDPAGGGFRVSLAPSRADTEYLAIAEKVVPTPAFTVTDEPSFLEAGLGPVSYLVVTAGPLHEAAEELATYRGQTGYRTAVVDVEDIYDELNYGIPSPHALQAFIAGLATTPGSDLRAVVLAGGGNFDYRNRLGLGGNLVPPLMVATPYGLFAGDLAYGDVDGDGLPEVAVGRIPALTAGELEAYVAKLAASESTEGPPWYRRALLLSDDADTGGDFAADSEAVAAFLPADFARDSVSLAELPVAQARAAMFAALGEGVGLVNYVGHGGTDRLAAEQLMTVADAPNLGTAGHLPVFATLTCVAGRFEVPGFESLAEALVLQPNGGMAAVWSPSGLSYSVDARQLNIGFAQGAFGFPGQTRTLGAAVLYALETYDGSLGYLPHVYNILGDPMVRLDR